MQQRLILTMVCWAIATLMPVAALAQTLSDQGPGVQNPVIGQLQDQALSSDLAWQTLAAITSEVGPRMAGSEADQRAVKWAVAKLHALGFERVLDRTRDLSALGEKPGERRSIEPSRTKTGDHSPRWQSG